MLVCTCLSCLPLEGARIPPLYHGTSLCLENITFEDYVVGRLLCFFTGQMGSSAR